MVFKLIFGAMYSFILVFELILKMRLSKIKIIMEQIEMKSKINLRIYVEIMGNKTFVL